jgi:polyhydroxyalkanoate synthesis regulator phasin
LSVNANAWLLGPWYSEQSIAYAKEIRAHIAALTTELAERTEERDGYCERGRLNSHAWKLENDDLRQQLADAHLFHAEQRKIIKGLEERLAESERNYEGCRDSLRIQDGNVDILRQRLADAEAWEKWGEQWRDAITIALKRADAATTATNIFTPALRALPAGAK